MATVVPDDSRQHFALPKNIIYQTNQVFFHKGKVLPSNALLLDDETPH